MAVHDLGYRRWHGVLAPVWTRIAVVTETSFRAGWKSRWTRRLLFLGWMPALWFAFAFFAWEQAVSHPEWRRLAVSLLSTLAQRSDLHLSFAGGDLAEGRHEAWSLLLLTFFRTSQAVLMVLLVGLIAPPLISQDVRSRAFLLYFSRPLVRSEYILGKASAVWGYVMLISTLPALCLYLLGVLLSPSFDVVLSTWDLPIRILLATLVIILPTTSVALMFSSLTRESRYAAFAWFAAWCLGWLSYSILSGIDRDFSSRPGNSTFQSRWTMISPYHVLGRVQQWIFGFVETDQALLPAIVLIVVTVVSLLVIFRRVSAPMRA